MARLLLLAALLAVTARPVSAQGEMPVKAELQVKLLLKVLTYDRQLEAKAGKGDELVIGIVSSPNSPASAKATAEISTELKKYLSKTVKQLKLQYYYQDYANAAKLEDWVKRRKISVLYVSPGNDQNLPAILDLSQKSKITTMTGVPEYVEKGVAVGIGARRSRPQVLINLTSTKREGSEFDASLLRIAKVVK